MEPTHEPTWAELIPLWILNLEARRLSPRTVELRLYQIGRLRKQYSLEPSSITSQQLIDMLANPRWSPNTASTARASYASFFGWAFDYEHLTANPASRLPSIKVPQGKPKPASDLAVANALANAPERTRLMTQVGISAGLRAMEIAQLHSSQVTILRKKKRKKTRAYLTITGKGSKTRVIPIPLDLAEELLEHNGWTFPGRINGHVSPAYVSKLVSRALPPGVTCHKLRHRYATRAYRYGGKNLRAVQTLLGHSSPATTAVYTAVDDDELWEVSLSAA